MPCARALFLTLARMRKYKGVRTGAGQIALRMQMTPILTSVKNIPFQLWGRCQRGSEQRGVGTWANLPAPLRQPIEPRTMVPPPLPKPASCRVTQQQPAVWVVAVRVGEGGSLDARTRTRTRTASEMRALTPSTDHLSVMLRPATTTDGPDQDTPTMVHG